MKEGRTKSSCSPYTKLICTWQEQRGKMLSLHPLTLSEHAPNTHLFWALRVGCACQATAICHVKSVRFCSHLDSFPLPALVAPQTGEERQQHRSFCGCSPQPHVTPKGMQWSRGLVLLTPRLKVTVKINQSRKEQSSRALAAPALICSACSELAGAGRS